jgi:hypothetical protein
VLNNDVYDDILTKVAVGNMCNLVSAKACIGGLTIFSILIIHWI